VTLVPLLVEEGWREATGWWKNELLNHPGPTGHPSLKRRGVIEDLFMIVTGSTSDRLLDAGSMN